MSSPSSITQAADTIMEFEAASPAEEITTLPDMYDDLVDQLLELPKGISLGGATYKDDFIRDMNTTFLIDAATRRAVLNMRLSSVGKFYPKCVELNSQQWVIKGWCWIKSDMALRLAWVAGFATLTEANNVQQRTFSRRSDS